jgi:hypothetical protein
MEIPDKGGLLMSYKEMQKALSTEPGSGGDFIPPVMAETYFQYISYQAKARQLFTVIPMESDEVMWPVLGGGFSAYHIKEGQRAYLSQLGTDKVSLKVKKTMAATTLTDELLENVKVDFDGIVKNEFAKALANGEDLAIIQGNPEHPHTAENPSEATEDNWFMLDARTAYKGLIQMSQEDPAPTPIDLGGADLQAATYRQIAMKLGKYAQDTSLLVTLMNPLTAFSQLWAMPEFIEASKYGTVTTLWTGEVGRIYGIRQTTWGAMPLNKTLTIPIFNAFIGDRKQYKFERDRDIYSQQNGVTTSMRACLGVPYPDAMVLCDNVGS